MMYIANNELIKTDKRIKVCKIASTNTKTFNVASSSVVVCVSDSLLLYLTLNIVHTGSCIVSVQILLASETKCVAEIVNLHFAESAYSAN